MLRGRPQQLLDPDSTNNETSYLATQTHADRLSKVTASFVVCQLSAVVSLYLSTNSTKDVLVF